MLIALVLGSVFFQYLSTLPLYLRRIYGLREDQIGMLLALNGFLIVAFEMVLIHWAERGNRLLLTGLGCLLVCVGFGMMPLGASIPWVAMTIVVWTSGEMLSLPLMNALVAGRAGARSQGRYMGMYNVAFSVSFVLGPVAGTFVFERFGPDVLWLGIGAMGLPLCLLAIALIRPFRREEAAR
jgi:predicted MFS family arabinose efflux permease